MLPSLLSLSCIVETTNYNEISTNYSTTSINPTKQTTYSSEVRCRFASWTKCPSSTASPPASPLTPIMSEINLGKLTNRTTANCGNVARIPDSSTFMEAYKKATLCRSNYETSRNRKEHTRPWVMEEIDRCNDPIKKGARFQYSFCRETGPSNLTSS